MMGGLTGALGRAALVAAVVLAPGLAGAAVTMGSCDGAAARLTNIPEPWEAHSRSFARGAVRVTLLDAAQPDAAAFHIAVMHDRLSETGKPYRACQIVGAEGQAGFSDVAFDRLEASFDADNGLQVRIPVQVLDGSGFRAADLLLVIDQGQDSIAAALK